MVDVRVQLRASLRAMWQGCQVREMLGSQNIYGYSATTDEDDPRADRDLFI